MQLMGQMGQALDAAMIQDTSPRRYICIKLFLNCVGLAWQLLYIREAIQRSDSTDSTSKIAPQNCCPEPLGKLSPTALNSLLLARFSSARSPHQLCQHVAHVPGLFHL